METIQVEYKEDRAVLRMDRGRANPINMKMVEELREQFLSLEENEAVRGVIFTGGDGIFSAGLDVVELYDYDQDTLAAFWIEFGALVEEMTAFPKPLVGAISGHAPAGGCVFAMPCDYRVMVDGNVRIGLNEVVVSVVLPSILYHQMAFCVGPAKAYDLILTGALLHPAEAKRIGLVHDVAPKERLMKKANAKMDEWLKLNQEVWVATKKNIRAPLLKHFNEDPEEIYGRTTDYWWSDEGRAIIGEFVASLQKK